MNSLALEANYIPHMRGQFANGSAVLFLGAGFSLGARNVAGESVPSARELSEALWKICFPSEAFDTTTQLQDIFETAQNQKPKELVELLRSSFTIDPDSCAGWYRRLLTMPWLRIYTLNIDDLVSKILSEESISRPFRTVSATTASDPIFD